MAQVCYSTFVCLLVTKPYWRETLHLIYILPGLVIVTVRVSNASTANQNVQIATFFSCQICSILFYNIT